MTTPDKASYPLPALVKNRLVGSDRSSGAPSSRRIVTSRNDVPYHYVVHSDYFAYEDYALHIGQHDKLSFFAAAGSPPVAVHLYDCRHGSPEYDRKFVIDVPTDGSLCLSIPPGYAHWFERLENVVTRNDYSLYGPADANTSWDVLQDNSTYPVAVMEAKRPAVRANTVPLPREVQFLIGEAVAKGWEGGATERGVVLSVTVDGSPETVFVDRTLTQPRMDDLPETVLATTEHFVGAHQAIRDESYSLASNTSSGLADTMVMDLPADWPEDYSLYPRLGLTLTALLHDGPTAEIELVDRRKDSATFGLRSQTVLSGDPRVSLRVDPGVALRFRGNGQLYYRVEYEVFLEPQSAPLKMAVPAGAALPEIAGPSELADPKALRLAAFE